MKINQIITEGPKNFDDMQMNNDNKQKDINYFYNDHAPNTFGFPKVIDKFKEFNVIEFSKYPIKLLFLVDDQNIPLFYVAIKKYKDGIAIGNVRSVGKVKATEFYKYLITKYKTLYSDSKQTPDGKKIWSNLAKYYPELKITDTGNRLKATD